MNCLEFRRIWSTEPGRKDPELAEHMAACGACSAFAVETESFDQLLVEALSLPVPESLRHFSLDSPAPHAATPRRAFPARRWALAASVVAAFLVSFGVWRMASPPDLGGELVAHILHEPASLHPAANPVEPGEIEGVLRRTGARFDAPIGSVSYIKTCPFRNKLVAHVVIEGSTGPVTLLLLPDVHVDAATPIDEEGFKGTIVPVGKGSVAIIGGDAEPLAPVEETVSRAVAWRI